MPGTYSVQLTVNGQTSSQQFRVLGDPRIEISDTDRRARQDALMSVYALNQSVNQANRAVNRLNGQVSDIRALIKQHEAAPESLAEEARLLSETIEELRQEFSQVGRDARVSNAIEGSTTRPTTDQLWQIDRAWDQAPGLIERINEIVNTSLPALYRACDENGIRPDPGKPIEVPRKPGG
jgi:ABC-type transporter Mla subunit MlaD